MKHKIELQSINLAAIQYLDNTMNQYNENIDVPDTDIPATRRQLLDQLEENEKMFEHTQNIFNFFDG